MYSATVKCRQCGYPAIVAKHICPECGRNLMSRARLTPIILHCFTADDFRRLRVRMILICTSGIALLVIPIIWFVIRGIASAATSTFALNNVIESVAYCDNSSLPWIDAIHVLLLVLYIAGICSAARLLWARLSSVWRSTHTHSVVISGMAGGTVCAVYYLFDITNIKLAMVPHISLLVTTILVIALIMYGVSVLCVVCDMLDRLEYAKTASSTVVKSLAPIFILGAIVPAFVDWQTAIEGGIACVPRGGYVATTAAIDFVISVTTLGVLYLVICIRTELRMFRASNRMAGGTEVCG